ncbi:MAG: Uma2 family endonuclease [Leptospiraceae bacterium]|nr:Uma2 family endonuclease [Leptospiraceae bacterium]
MAISTLTKPLTETEFPTLPRGDELPYDDDTPLESERHLFQIILLLETIQPWLQESGKGYVGGNMFIYFSPNQIKTEQVRGPDFFIVVNADSHERKSWVVWEEGLSPDVVIELLSETTKKEDKTTKKRIYEKQLCVSEYFWYDPFDPADWVGHELKRGSYSEKRLDRLGRYISKKLGLALVKWNGVFMGRETTWLRFETLDGHLLPTKEEREKQRAEREKQRAEREKQRAEREKQRAEKECLEKEKERAEKEKLAEKLRELGYDPDKIIL